jgi:hypothetical protein
MHEMSEQILKYDQMLYESGPVSFTDFVNSKYDKIHADLYNDALQKYLVEHPEYMLYRSAYNFIETKQPEYWLPSYVSIISKSIPHTRKRVWLNDWWSKYQNKSNKSSNLYIDSDTLTDATVTEMNYVTGEATMSSKFTGNKFKVPFSKLSYDTPVSDDLNLDDTFASKLTNGNGLAI